MNLQFEVKSIDTPEFSKSVLRWHLDNPKNGQLVRETDQEFEIRGWILTNEKRKIELVIEGQGSTTHHNLNIVRPDVIVNVLSQPHKEHPQLSCGFNIPVESARFPLQIGFNIDGTTLWASKINLAPARKVIAGKAGYLFLDNDTNRSIDQYEGKVLISKAGLDGWERHFSSLSASRPKPWLFVIAPAKEFVLPDCYPFKRAAVTPVDQFLTHFRHLEEKILYPLDLLKCDGHMTYSTGDTHWTDYGAYIAAKAIVDKFDIKNPFPEDKLPFHLTACFGDLISKHSPGNKFLSYVADFESADSMICFDNKIASHGRIILFQNKHSSSQLKAVLFGDSFSTNLCRWLSAAFSRLLFIHTAGAVDAEILAQENPDCVIMQSNSRFLVAPPDLQLSVRNVISKKINQLSSSDVTKFTREISLFPESYYKKLMIDLLQDPGH